MFRLETPGGGGYGNPTDEPETSLESTKKKYLVEKGSLNQYSFIQQSV